MTTQTSTRSHLTAGVAAFGVAAIAIAPIQPLSHQAAIAPQQVSNLAMGLVSSIDPITPWIDTIQGAADNVVGLFDAFAAQPFPITTQVIANQLTYLGELPNIGLILNQVIGNIGNAVKAPFAADPGTLDTSVTPGAVNHSLVWALLPQIIDIPTALQPVLDFTTSYTSGILIGLVGPVVAPVLALVDSVSSIVHNLVKADVIGALNDLINIPAAVTNAFLNGGQTLELTPLLNLLGVKIPDVERAGITMGGLLSPGGSMFNALDADLSITMPPLPTINAALHGVPTGSLGSLIGLTNTIAGAIKITPPNSAAAKAAAARATAAEATTPEAAAPEVTAADVAPQAGSGDNDSPKPSIRAKSGRSADNGSAAGQDAPKRSAKAGASRAA